jgi:hypothetical protein
MAKSSVPARGIVRDIVRWRRRPCSWGATGAPSTPAGHDGPLDQADDRGGDAMLAEPDRYGEQHAVEPDPRRPGRGRAAAAASGRSRDRHSHPTSPTWWQRYCTWPASLQATATHSGRGALLEHSVSSFGAYRNDPHHDVTPWRESRSRPTILLPGDGRLGKRIPSRREADRKRSITAIFGKSVCTSVGLTHLRVGLALVTVER